MDRLEMVRTHVDAIIQKLQNEENRKFAYIHTYGVCQHTAMLALARGENIELASISAMLHDIATYAFNCPHKEHAQQSADYATKLLNELEVFCASEIKDIHDAILVHSDKLNRHDSPLAEILKDSDVLQHYLYNVNIPLPEQDKVRLFYLLEDLRINHK